MPSCLAYLAGPDVFLPNAAQHAAAKIAICAKYGITGRAPLHPEVERVMCLPRDAAWREIYRWDVEMMEACAIVIANLTPFRGASADAGTLVEIGWFLGRGRPVFGYSNCALPFAARSMAQRSALPDPLEGLGVEGFDLPDNLMIPGAVEYGGGLSVILPPDDAARSFDALDVFERCVAAVAGQLEFAAARQLGGEAER
ncbi:MAG: nucleoside 2-deoxyribosyltransferase [Acidocella sp. 20-63-7]|nr:MAG: nucleoside 2-deoxyribosyltransferase [Acidocella sp. 20-63-7]HQT46712.1 nucleoside 2-deoxyribosyltransferase [Acidocella sp.]